jgi:hypothetical protein
MPSAMPPSVDWCSLLLVRPILAPHLAMGFMTSTITISAIIRGNRSHNLVKELAHQELAFRTPAVPYRRSKRRDLFVDCFHQGAESFRKILEILRAD